MSLGITSIAQAQRVLKSVRQLVRRAGLGVLLRAVPVGCWLTTLALGGSVQPSRGISAQEAPQIIELTIERMVELTMSTSYTIRRLNLDVQRQQYNLKAQQARLKSRVDLELIAPAFRRTSEPKWNAALGRDEVIQEETRRWEGELSIRQPVILFGYPTNGYLSFNNRMYRYNQIDDDGDPSVTYYNRYYFSYNQPLFQPNSLKNSLEQAELSLEGTQLRFYSDVVNIVKSVDDGYHSLFGQYHRRTLRLNQVDQLERALDLALAFAQVDSTRIIEVDQIQVELANARENLQSTESSIRLSFSYVRSEYGLSPEDSLAFEPEFELDPVPVDMFDATGYAMGLTPRMRQLAIGLRNQEIRLDRTKSRGGFRLNLNMSYGREVRDDYFDELWQDPENSYTIYVTAQLPIWDWGERRARIQASEIGIDQTELRIEESEIQIVSNVRNEVLNVQDREQRTMSMMENMELARGISETNFQRYREGTISALDLLLSLRRETDTTENFLEAYVSWKGSLSRIQQQTFFSFERGEPLLDWFREEGWVPENGLTGGQE